MDEAEFIPTNKAAVVNEDKQFNDAMSIWFNHKYKDGAKLLREYLVIGRWVTSSFNSLHTACIHPSTAVSLPLTQHVLARSSMSMLVIIQCLWWILTACSTCLV